jgi:hypothetical protein
VIKAKRGRADMIKIKNPSLVFLDAKFTPQCETVILAGLINTDKTVKPEVKSWSGKKQRTF